MTPAESVAALMAEQVNEEIAKRRRPVGLRVDTFSNNTGVVATRVVNPPNYCGDWSLAGPLFDELLDSAKTEGAFRLVTTQMLAAFFREKWLRTESVSRAWLVANWSKA